MVKKVSNFQAPTQFIMITLGIFLLLLGVIIPRIIFRKRNSLTYNVSRIKESLGFNTMTSKYILRNGIPYLDLTAGEDDPFTVLQINWVEIYWYLAANIKHSTPFEILRTQMPLLALMKPRQIQIKIPPKLSIPQPLETEPPQIPKPQNIPDDFVPKPESEPVVFIYHTHTSESYIPESGKDHLLNQRGDVVKVGSYLQKVLEEKYNIQCQHSETIHDQVPFRDSYKRSQVTVINYLKEHPKTQVVIDLHRDATPGLASNVMIKEIKCATIVIVMGSDKMGLPHPHWKVNLAFAQKLNDDMNLYYPGLSNGIIMSDARYNQYLHTHAILVEFGDQNSTLTEVYHSVDLFAEVLANILAKDSSGTTTLDN